MEKRTLQELVVARELEFSAAYHACLLLCYQSSNCVSNSRNRHEIEVNLVLLPKWSSACGLEPFRPQRHDTLLTYFVETEDA